MRIEVLRFSDSVGVDCLVEGFIRHRFRRCPVGQRSQICAGPAGATGRVAPVGAAHAGNSPSWTQPSTSTSMVSWPVTITQDANERTLAIALELHGAAHLGPSRRLVRVGAEGADGLRHGPAGLAA